MEDIINIKECQKRVVLITDCDTGFGIAMLEILIKDGNIAIAFGKDEEIINKTKKKLQNVLENSVKGTFVLLKCDIINTQQLEESFNYIQQKYQGIDILINNASCNIDCQVSSGSFEDFNQIIDTNINALVACTNFASKLMLNRKFTSHIINMNDIKAYEIPDEANKSIYLATKASVTSINEILRYEFRHTKANIKVTNVACGGFDEDYSEDPTSKQQDLVAVVLGIINTSEHLHVHEILIEWESEY
ncbi:hypothetical protein K1T71_007959 [Dendrolimus kikuchii]|uniref:Uncharacterized protein n=1 Tax=Dendrolimus kikuchii TaxID=765133 RepID=A0ACC1CZ69_9NEOP|nr:hypothetical protein K1T71_007959 [Dendrolimus kikuchii]